MSLLKERTTKHTVGRFLPIVTSLTIGGADLYFAHEGVWLLVIAILLFVISFVNIWLELSMGDLAHNVVVESARIDGLIDDQGNLNI